MAATARAAIQSDVLRAAAARAHGEHLAEFPYVCPIPAETRPPVAS